MLLMQRLPVQSEPQCHTRMLLHGEPQHASCTLWHPPPCYAANSLPSQRERFLEYLPSHSQGVAGIMLASSLNAVCYNMVSHAASRHAHRLHCLASPALVLLCSDKHHCNT